LILNQLDLSIYGEDLLNPDIDIEDYFDWTVITIYCCPQNIWQKYYCMMYIHFMLL
jgi:hypothetical protein